MKTFVKKKDKAYRNTKYRFPKVKVVQFYLQFLHVETVTWWFYVNNMYDATFYHRLDTKPAVAQQSAITPIYPSFRSQTLISSSSHYVDLTPLTHKHTRQ